MAGGAAVAWPFAGQAQQARTIGILMNGRAGETMPQSNVAAFVDGLRALGYVDGKNLTIEYRWNSGNAERAQVLAQELVKLSPAVILCASTTNLAAFQRTKSSIPVVFVQVSDPVAQGFVTSVTHPGGNITGFTAFEFSIGGKWLEILKEISPRLSRVAVMSNPTTSPQTRFFLKAIEAAAPTFGVEVVEMPVRSDADIARSIEKLGSSGTSGLILPTDTFTRLRQGRIADLGIQFRVPTLSAVTDFIDEGGLLYYGSTSAEELAKQYREAASYVVRILNGTKPGDLPIQLTTKFELAINRKTAKALGLDVPAKLLFTADRVLE
jgi:putative ABC transport system substrate-binding protein